MQANKTCYSNIILIPLPLLLILALHSFSKTKSLGWGYIILDIAQMHRGSRASSAQLKIYRLNPKLVWIQAPSWGPEAKA